MLKKLITSFYFDQAFSILSAANFMDDIKSICILYLKTLF